MEIQIPEKLKRGEMNFVLIEKSGKKPFQEKWQTKKIKFNDEELLNHLKNGGNYGVIGGGEKKLLIVDFDNKLIQETIVAKLPETFTVKTGSGMLHKYFFSDSSQSFKIFDSEMLTALDVQGDNKQVVGAGSIHPNGNRYEVIEDKDIAFIPYSELKALILPFDRKPKKEEIKWEKPAGYRDNSLLDDIKSSVRIESVLSEFGVDTSHNPSNCPLHESKGGKCLGWNNEVAHCFHCDGAWNIFSAVMDFKKVNFKEALEWLCEKYGFTKQLEDNRKKYIESLNTAEQNHKKEIKMEFLELISGKEKKWSEATELLVDYLRSILFLYTTKDDNKSEVWVYKDGIYVPQGKSEIKELLRDLLGAWYSQYVYGLVIAKIEPDTYIDSNILFGNVYRDEVPVSNGILNVFTRELKPFTPEKIFFNKLPIKYNPTAICPKIDKFLEDVLSDKEDKDVFYELGGFCLLNEYTFEKAFMFVGNGRNGKDKCLELLKRTLGVDNCTSIPLSALVPDSFVIGEMFGKKANLAGEVSNLDLKDTSMFKSCTGRSLLSAKRKFLNNISFINHAKFIFACNDLPMVYDISRGFWDRWVLLEFPNTFITKEEFDLAEDKSRLKVRDEEIISKITTPEELSGLLNKFLNGLTNLFQQRKFSLTKGTDEIKNLWIRKSNSFVAFCLDMIEQDYEKRISKKELRQRYTSYCKEHRVKPKSDFVIHRFLQEEFGASETQEYELGVRYWDGIKWKR
jgi:P4 family phage/plasmid primase-like protien